MLFGENFSGSWSSGRLQPPPPPQRTWQGGLVGTPHPTAQGSAPAPAVGVRPRDVVGFPRGRAAPGLSRLGVGGCHPQGPPRVSRGPRKAQMVLDSLWQSGDKGTPPPPRDGDTSGCRGDSRTEMGLCHGGGQHTHGCCPPPLRTGGTPSSGSCGAGVCVCVFRVQPGVASVRPRPRRAVPQYPGGPPGRGGGGAAPSHPAPRWGERAGQCLGGTGAGGLQAGAALFAGRG